MLTSGNPLVTRSTITSSSGDVGITRVGGPHGQRFNGYQRGSDDDVIGHQSKTRSPVRSLTRWANIRPASRECAKSMSS